MIVYLKDSANCLEFSGILFSTFERVNSLFYTYTSHRGNRCEQSFTVEGANCKFTVAFKDVQCLFWKSYS